MRGTRQALEDCNEWGTEEEITKSVALGCVERRVFD